MSQYCVRSCTFIAPRPTQGASSSNGYHLFDFRVFECPQMTFNKTRCAVIMTFLIDGAQWAVQGTLKYDRLESSKNKSLHPCTKVMWKTLFIRGRPQTDTVKAIKFDLYVCLWHLQSCTNYLCVYLGLIWYWSDIERFFSCMKRYIERGFPQNKGKLHM